MDIRWAWAGLLLLAGCGGGDFGGSSVAQACSKNETAECACPGGAKGAQTCLEDLSAFGKCECASSGDSDGGAVTRDPVTGEVVETWTLGCTPTGFLTDEFRGCRWLGGTAAAPVMVQKICRADALPTNCTATRPIPDDQIPAGQAVCVTPSGPNGQPPTRQLCNL